MKGTILRNLPPLSSLRAFEATARTGSLTQAAKELHRTHGAISRQLKLLAEHAGVALFEKDGTGLRLTPGGHAFYASVSSVFEQLEGAYGRLRNRGDGPSLHVACSATFAMRWLVPHLSAFYRLRPDIRIRLSMTSAKEIRAEGAELIIAWDLSSYPESDRDRAIALAPARFGPVVAPDRLQSKRKRTRIAHDHTSAAWDQWEVRSGKKLAFGDFIQFPHTHLCIEAAVAGLGDALVEQRLVRKELEDGTLVAPLGFVAFAAGWQAVPIAGQPISDEGRAFIDWLGNALGQ
ncbi:LysR substrate-binding domain-containing protein [Alcaligenaceae bacterium B3P038]|nr:LysR substrate-binding domain-containing protein [Alcaligenaceae bacterium B3P038]